MLTKCVFKGFLLHILLFLLKFRFKKKCNKGTSRIFCFLLQFIQKKSRWNHSSQTQNFLMLLFMATVVIIVRWMQNDKIFWNFVIHIRPFVICWILVRRENLYLTCSIKPFWNTAMCKLALISLFLAYSFFNTLGTFVYSMNHN